MILNVGIFLLGIVVTMQAQTFVVSPDKITFDTTLTTMKDSLPFWIKNNSGQPQTIVDCNVVGEVFSLRDTSFILNPFDSIRTWIYFSSNHNLSYSGFVFIESNLSSGSVVVPLFGTKKYSEPLYAATQGKSGEALKTALTTIAKSGQTTLGYTIARDRMYGNIDNVGGQVECVYTGRTATFNTRAGATSNNFNCEHTWPQSKFSEADPMVSDIHHLFPTDEAANSKRSNYPFGVVVSSSWNTGGSKYGTGYGGNIVFEPRDAHKGDCARAMLYFIIRYPNNYGSFWTENPYQDAAMRDWNKRFPPTAKSKARNNAIQQYQGNRNPFIDHPEFAERINSFSGTATTVTAPQLIVSPMQVTHRKTSIGEPIQWTLILANGGNAALKITSANFSNTFYSLVDSIADIDSYGFRKINIQYLPTVASQDSTATLSLSYHDGTAVKTVVISLTASSMPVSVDRSRIEVPFNFSLGQNYPNPFNPSTTIEYSIPSSDIIHWVSLRVYNVLGESVADLVNEPQAAGRHSISFNAERLSSGMYFYTLRTHGSTLTRRLLLIK